MTHPPTLSDVLERPILFRNGTPYTLPEDDREKIVVHLAAASDDHGYLVGELRSDEGSPVVVHRANTELAEVVSRIARHVRSKNPVSELPSMLDQAAVLLGGGAARFSDPSEFDPSDFGDPDDDRVIWLCDGPYKDGYHRIVKARDLKPGDEIDGRTIKDVTPCDNGTTIDWHDDPTIDWLDDPTTDYYPPGSIVLLPPIVE